MAACHGCGLRDGGHPGEGENRGSSPLSFAESIREQIAAVRSPPPSEPTQEVALRPSGTVLLLTPSPFRLMTMHPAETMAFERKRSDL